MAYNPEIAKRICELVATNSKSLKKIVEENEGLPKIFTIYDWLANNKEFADMYARAKEDQADLLADEIIDIADTPIEGVILETDDQGRTKERKGDMLGHRKLQVDARKWVAAKLKPRKYGDKLDVTSDNKELKSLTTIKWGDNEIEV